ncbi:ubiquinone anaerobic biosynthesis accessory factor UbiT [Pseudorhizobium marinum]|uniref:ubiquinone anaerobic biosynthesis accessory factor UbiT n=1 Tax=Pseudorhizobium marinum TaxID=1496690 RepID=UPI0004975A28
MRLTSLLAMPLDALPIIPVQHVTQRLFQRLLEAHPDLFDRLGEYRGCRFSFTPTDLPLIFLVEPGGPSLSLKRKGAVVSADAGVEAPLVMLLALLEGRCDADALFFSRDLQVSGDMEAILALRNALDDCDIDLPRDLAQLGGPLAPLCAKFATEVRRRALKEMA